MRKQRTRGHVIEDLSVNFVEKQVLLAGYTFERIRHDYGFDGIILTFDEDGRVENYQILVQVKATDKPVFSKHKGMYKLSLSKRDLEAWLHSRIPVILVLYTALSDEGFYLDLEDFFRKNSILLKNVNKFVQVLIPETNIFDGAALQRFRKLKNNLI